MDDKVRYQYERSIKRANENAKNGRTVALFGALFIIIHVFAYFVLNTITTFYKIPLYAVGIMAVVAGIIIYAINNNKANRAEEELSRLESEAKNLR
jgi:Flp pilus assembly protein TadB